MTFSTRNEGFRVTFPNGYTISIGTSSHHYCQNHVLGLNKNQQWESKDCEIAVIRNEDSEKRQYVLTNQVEGYATPLQFARLIEYVSALPKNYISKDIVAGMDEIFKDKYNE